jgi:hypothetical protein
MGWWLAIALAVAAVVVFLVRSPVFRAYRRRKKAIGSEGLGHRQRRQDNRLP